MAGSCGAEAEQRLQPKRRKASKKKSAETSASSAVAPAAAERGGGSGEAGLPPTGNLPKRAKAEGSRKELS